MRRIIRLLVVDDDPAWEVSVVTDGQAPLDLLFAPAGPSPALPELILLHWHMPSVDGREVLRRVKADINLCSIPVIIFSTSQSERIIRDAYRNHANGFVR